MMDAAQSVLTSTAEAPPELQRTYGRVEVVFGRRARRAVVERRYQEGAAQIRVPRDHRRGCTDAALINLAGGLTGGDVMEQRITWNEGAIAGITAPAAEKIYKSSGGQAVIDSRLEIGPEAWAEWLPQETIVFERGDLERRQTLSVAQKGRLLFAEILVFGRLAMGEELFHARLVDRVRVEFDGRLVWYDVNRLEPPLDRLLDATHLGGGARSLATLLYVGADAAAHVDRMRELAQGVEMPVGVTCMPPVLIVRLHHADPTAVRRGIVHLVASTRHALADLPAQLPRFWHV